MTRTTRKWIVGLGLGPHDHGPILFGKWLAEHGGDQLVGVHVLEEAHLQAALRYHHLPELEANAMNAVRAVVEANGATASFAVVEVIEGRNSEETLTAAAAYRRCDGIIVGRHAGRDGHPVVRLGRIARRLLRATPTSLVIVPPDFDPTAVGKGPVVLACGLDEDGTGATEFARHFANQFGRPLELVHVAASPEHHSAQYAPEATLAKIRADSQGHAEDQLAQWAEVHRLEDATRVVRLGGTVDQLAAHARERDALMIITGSRRLSGFERLFLASAGTELASHAVCPIVVIPPS